MLKVIINAFGPDRPGIVYKLSRIIFSLKGNIEESKMIRLESDFTLLMLIALPDINFSLLEEKLNNLANLNISFKITKKNQTKIECHYFKNGGFFESDEWILDNTDSIQNLPIVIIRPFRR